VTADSPIPSDPLAFLVQRVRERKLLAADVAGDNARVVTAYVPEPAKWSADFRRRIKT
jgi:hypothetical protein